MMNGETFLKVGNKVIRLNAIKTIDLDRQGPWKAGAFLWIEYMDGNWEEFSGKAASALREYFNKFSVYLLNE